MNSADLRIAFAGTPDFAAGHLEHLIQQNHNVVGVFSQPNRQSGRGQATRPTPVKLVAETHQIPVYQPESLDEFAKEALRDLSPDVLVVVAFGMLLSEEVLTTPRLGCINVHASLLPRWRGAAPIERAILAGDSETGVSIMQMDKGLDTGAVLLKKSTPISDDDDAGTVTNRLLQQGCEGLSDVLADLTVFQDKAVPQDDTLATYAAKLSKEEAKIDWVQSALTIQRQVQALYPRSPAWCEYRDERIRIIRARAIPYTHDCAPGTITKINKSFLQVACGSELLEASVIQLPGKKAAGISDVLNGHPDLFSVGSLL